MQIDIQNRKCFIHLETGLSVQMKSMWLTNWFGSSNGILFSLINASFNSTIRIKFNRRAKPSRVESSQFIWDSECLVRYRSTWWRSIKIILHTNLFIRFIYSSSAILKLYLSSFAHLLHRLPVDLTNIYQTRWVDLKMNCVDIEPIQIVRKQPKLWFTICLLLQIWQILSFTVCINVRISNKLANSIKLTDIALR